MNRVMYHLLLILLALAYDALMVFAQWSPPVRLQGLINTDPSIKTWPCINASGDTLYYSKLGTGGNENICYSYRYNDSLWSAPLFLGPQINTSQRELSPSIGPGDSILYFVTYGRAGGYGSYDIWYSRRGPDGQWQEPVNAGPNINTSSMEWGVHLSRNGQHLYFSSTHNYPGHVGGLDMYMSEWQGDGWGPPQILSGIFNGYEDDENVTLPADENYLILTMARWSATLGDLWFSQQDSNQWTTPVLIQDLISATNEDGATLSPDGLTVYLASARHDTNHVNSQIYISHSTLSSSPSRSVVMPPRHSYLYPNPYRGGIFKLQMQSNPASLRTLVRVYDLLGRTVGLRQTIAERELNLESMMQGLTNGRYWIRIEQAGTKPEILPFIMVK